jgi:hypothetical protein
MWMTTFGEAVPTSEPPSGRLLCVGDESTFDFQDFDFPIAGSRECIARFLVLIPDTIIGKLCGVGEEEEENLALDGLVDKRPWIRNCEG